MIAHILYIIFFSAIFIAAAARVVISRRSQTSPAVLPVSRERDSSKGLGVVKRSRTLLSQFFAKLDFIPPRAYDIGGGRYGDRMSFLALVVVCAVVIYCVKRNNPASADDADAAMVPADAIANPTLFKRLLNA